jgi:uncharacterized membrane protein YGL010W
MNGYFRRQLADYVEYHRDWWNGVMHIFGIISLFLGAVLPLSAWPVPLFGAPITVATVAVLPVLVYWLLLDTAIGTGILVAAVLLLSTAATIVSHVSIVGVWSITAVLIVIGVAFQIVGHRIFERRQPSIRDNPSHFLLGPMFVMAKLYVVLGFRHDLAVILQERLPQERLPQERLPQERPQQTLRGSSPYPEKLQSEAHPKS